MYVVERSLSHPEGGDPAVPRTEAGKRKVFDISLAPETTKNSQNSVKSEPGTPTDPEEARRQVQRNIRAPNCVFENAPKWRGKNAQKY